MILKTLYSGIRTGVILASAGLIMYSGCKEKDNILEPTPTPTQNPTQKSSPSPSISPTPTIEPTPTPEPTPTAPNINLESLINYPSNHSCFDQNEQVNFYATQSNGNILPQGINCDWTVDQNTNLQGCDLNHSYSTSGSRLISFRANFPANGEFTEKKSRIYVRNVNNQNPVLNYSPQDVFIASGVEFVLDLSQSGSNSYDPDGFLSRATVNWGDGSPIENYEIDENSFISGITPTNFPILRHTYNSFTWDVFGPIINIYDDQCGSSLINNLAIIIE